MPHAARDRAGYPYGQRKICGRPRCNGLSYHFSMRPTVILLSFNSESTLGATLESALRVAGEIFVVDSFSSDGTVELARKLGATVVQHPFDHYGAQRNWAIDNLPITRPWQLHLDADEWMNDELGGIHSGAARKSGTQRLLHAPLPTFSVAVLRRGGTNPTWHLRPFLTGVGAVKIPSTTRRLLSSGSTGGLPGEMIDDIRMSLSEWTARHNRWADGEVEELDASELSGALLSPMHSGIRHSASDSCARTTIACPCSSGPLRSFFTASSFALVSSTVPKDSSFGRRKPSGSASWWTPKSGNGVMAAAGSMSDIRDPVSKQFAPPVRPDHGLCPPKGPELEGKPGIEKELEPGCEEEPGCEKEWDPPSVKESEPRDEKESEPRAEKESEVGELPAFVKLDWRDPAPNELALRSIPRPLLARPQNACARSSGRWQDVTSRDLTRCPNRKSDPNHRRRNPGAPMGETLLTERPSETRLPVVGLRERLTKARSHGIRLRVTGLA